MTKFRKADRPLEYWPLEPMEEHRPSWSLRYEVPLAMFIVFLTVFLGVTL